MTRQNTLRFSRARRTGWRALLLASAGVVAVAAVGTAADVRTAGTAGTTSDLRLEEVRHTRLTKSEPAKDTTLAASPATVTLWFSKPVQARLTRIQVVDAKGTEVAVDKPEFQGTTETVVVAHLRGATSPGTYTVNWATTSKDSHVVKGSYAFKVSGPR